MIKKNKIAPLVLLASFWVSPIYAADAKAGEAKSAMCMGCHGPGGTSSNAQWPILAAQQQPYIINQLEAFKSGTRKNSIMAGMAANLSSEDMANLAAFFASQPAARAGGDPELAKQGKDKSAICLGCHGANAAGNGEIPRLAGQHPGYLITQLKHFKAGERKSGHMQAIASSLSEEDMKALTAYFGSL